MTYAEIQAIAEGLGIAHLRGINLADYEIMSDGCSGGLSWLYALGGKKISCYKCCVAHDFLYGWGGTKKDRKKADQLLQWCAANSGDFSGWNGSLKRIWRWMRSWIMYAGVRIAGGGPKHWAGKSPINGGG